LTLGGGFGWLSRKFGLIADNLVFVEMISADIMDGKPSELESQSGAVVRLGKEMGVDTPINTFIYDSLLPMEMRARKKLTF